MAVSGDELKPREVLGMAAAEPVVEPHVQCMFIAYG